MSPDSKPDFHVLYVCRANQCRSAIAEVLLTDALSAFAAWHDVGWTVGSAGVSASSGSGLHPRAASELQARGHDGPGISAFVSTSLTSGAVIGADLILTAERAQRSAVVQIDPTSLRRTFTMRQFARLVSPTSRVGLGGTARTPDSGEFTRSAGLALVAAAITAQGGRQPVAPVDDDIADPVGGSAKAFRQCYTQIASTLGAFGVLAPDAVASGGARWWKPAR